MNNIWFTWGDVFNASLQNLWFGFMQFVPKLIVAIIFFIIGWVLGNLIAKAFEHVISDLFHWTNNEMVCDNCIFTSIT